MDTPEMRAGATCYMGINVEGALLSIGDGHARQGEGETCGVAVEAAMNSVIAIELLKGVPCPRPRLENDDYIMTTGSARPLEDAFRISQTEMVYWLQEEYGFDKLDAYQFVTQASESPAANVCDPTTRSCARSARSGCRNRSSWAVYTAGCAMRVAATRRDGGWCPSFWVWNPLQSTGG
jgi:acetamidase/formamidase